MGDDDDTVEMASEMARKRRVIVDKRQKLLPREELVLSSRNLAHLKVGNKKSLVFYYLNPHGNDVAIPGAS